MLDRVIEHPRLARQPLARRPADPKAAARWHDERQMNRETRIGDAGVRRNAGIGIEDREEGRRSACRDPRPRRHGLEQPRRHRAARDVPGNRFALVPEKIGAPAARAIQFAELIERHVLWEVDVGLQAVPIGHQYAQQLGTDLVARRLELVKPGKIPTLEELDRRQLREIHPGRLRIENLAFAHQRLETQIDASLALAAMAFVDRGQRLLECRAKRREVGLHHRSGVTQCLLNRRRRLAARGDDRQRILVGARRIAQVAGRFEVLAFLQQRREVPRLELERPLDRVHLLRAPPECLEAARKVRPQ